MTSNTPDPNPPTSNPPTPQIFSIFSLPSYEDAVKSSGDPPPYEQALTDLRVADLEAQYRDSLPPDTAPRRARIQNQTPPSACQRRVYRSFCWGLAVLIIFVLGYMIYNGIFRYLTIDKNE